MAGKGNQGRNIGKPGKPGWQPTDKSKAAGRTPPPSGLVSATSAPTSPTPETDYGRMYVAIPTLASPPNPYHDDDKKANPGTHPLYGGHNWGIQYNEHWDDWGVNHGYYGSSETDDTTGNVYIDSSPVSLLPTGTRWTSDQKTKANASTIWQHRELITRELNKLGYTPQRQIRIRADINPGNLTILISPYDRERDFVPFTIPLLRS